MGIVGRRVARGSFIIFVREVLANLIALIGSIVVARLLGPEEYGLSSVALIYPGMAIAVAGLGLGQAVMRFSSAASIGGGSSEYVYSGLLLSSISAALASLTMLILSPRLAGLLGRPPLASGISILSIYVFSTTLYSSIEASLLGLGRYGDTAVAAIARAATRVSTAVPLALLGLGYRAVLWGLSIGYLVGSSIGLAMLLRCATPVKPRLNHAVELLRYSLPLYIPTLISSPVSQAVTGFLASRASDFEMGNLSVANLLLTPIGLIGGALGTAVFSSIPALADDEKLRTAVNKAVLYTNMVIIPLALGLAVLSKPMVFLLYGSSYSAAPSYLLLLSVPYIFNALAAGTMTLYANTVGDTLFTGIVTLVDVAIRAPITLAMISILGITGYLVTPIVVNPVTAGITLLLGEKRYSLAPWHRRNAMVALWSLASLALALPASLAVSEHLGAAVYVATLVITANRFIRGEEAREIVELSGSIPIVGGLLQSIGRTMVEKLW